MLHYTVKGRIYVGFECHPEDRGLAHHSGGTKHRDRSKGENRGDEREKDTVNYWLNNTFSFSFSCNLDRFLSNRREAYYPCIYICCVTYHFFEETVIRYVQYACNLSGIGPANTTSPAVKQPLRGQ